MSQVRLTMEEFVRLSPEGEQAAIEAGNAPEQAAGQMPDELTTIEDLVVDVQDLVLESVPAGALANATQGALEEATEVFLSGADREMTYHVEQDGTAVSVSRQAGKDGRSLSVELKQGGKRVTFAVTEAG